MCCDSSGHSNGPDNAVTTVAATLHVVRQGCNDAVTTMTMKTLCTLVWYLVVTTDSTVTSVTTDSAVTSVTTDSAVTSVTTDSTVTAMFMLVSQRCAHHCESSGNCQRCHSIVSFHHCLYHCYPSAVTVSTVALLSAPSLSQCCARFRCHNAVHIGV